MDSTDFHKLLLSRGTFFCYSGLLSEEVLSAISSIVREQVTDIDHDEGLTTRVFGIFIEQTQNIIRYSEEARARGWGSLRLPGNLLNSSSTLWKARICCLC